MNIYLVRHGDAEAGSGKTKESERKLTEEGERRTRKNALYIKNYLNAFDYIITSPLLRAKQTAEIFANVFGYSKEIIIEPLLSPGSKTEDLIDTANYLDGKNILFVGHQPDMAYHVSELISSSGALIEFKKSSAAKISFSRKAYAGKGVLEFLIPPVPEK